MQHNEHGGYKIDEDGVGILGGWRRKVKKGRFKIFSEMRAAMDLVSGNSERNQFLVRDGWKVVVAVLRVDWPGTVGRKRGGREF